METTQQLPFYERWIERYFPGWALNRTVDRIKLDAVRKYDAASHGNRTKGWKATGASADAENQNALFWLRNRSRDLTRNTSYGRRAIQNITNNVVGSGIRPKIKGAKAEFIRQQWKLWADTTACDFEESKNFYGISRLIMRSVSTDGEALVIKRRVKSKTKGGLPIQLQVLEADHLDNTRDAIRTDSGGRIVQGVEFDAEGKRIGYWIFPFHPGDGIPQTSVFVPAADVLHIFEELRPGQTRGVPFGVAAMIRMRDLNDFTDAELVKQRAAATFVAFVSSATTPSATDPAKPSNEITPFGKLTPGTIYKGSPGESITFGSPPAFQSYDIYTSAVLHEIAAGFGTTYEGLTGDLSKVNFSSLRAGANDFQLNVESWQTDLMIMKFCLPVWNFFMNAMGITVKLSDAEINATEIDWTLPRRVQINPVDDNRADMIAVRSGFKSLQEVIAERGYDFDDVINELQKGLQVAKDLGLVLDTDPSQVSAQGQVQAGTPPADGGGDGSTAPARLTGFAGKRSANCQCPECQHNFDYNAISEAGMGWVRCPNCHGVVTQLSIVN